ncbi:transcriptional regulator [Nonomuraea sp. B12E4]|uniref:MmyB family transcriptional regulator n=1 Tax=Nonomuraea sp. B12E4 TaxID=3153564 RepID=UPI00325F812B
MDRENPIGEPAHARRAPSRWGQVNPSLLRLMERWPHTPAMVLDHCTTVLAASPLGMALFDGHTNGGDMVRPLFLNPRARDFYLDWDLVAGSFLTGLREAAGAHGDDARLIGVVGELSLKSDPFRRMWARNDLSREHHEPRRFRHRLVGELTLRCQILTVDSVPGQHLVVFQAEPDSPSELALSLLDRLTADGPGQDSEPPGDQSP